jgi:hypothetical protein
MVISGVERTCNSLMEDSLMSNKMEFPLPEELERPPLSARARRPKKPPRLPPRSGSDGQPRGGGGQGGAADHEKDRSPT